MNQWVVVLQVVLERLFKNFLKSIDAVKNVCIMRTFAADAAQQKSQVADLQAL